MLTTSSSQEADLILTGGRIITVDADDSVAEALAVAGERILRVGTDEEVLQTRGPDTEVIDLEGCTVLPGLIDSHTHALEASLTEFDHRIPEMRTIPDVLDYVRQRAEATSEGDWIVVQQAFVTRLKERRYPTREELDEAAPHHPVIFRTGADASLNALALARFGIDESYEAPPGSKVERDEGGTPTGILREWKGMIELPETGQAPTPEEREERVQMLLRDYNAVGITSFADRRTYTWQMELYQRLHDAGRLTARATLSRYIDPSAPLDDIRQQIRAIAQESPTTDGDAMLHTVGVKIYLDGGMLTGSAYMLEPWGQSEMYAIDDPDYQGLLFVEKEKLLPIVRMALEEGMQFTAHSVGSGAVQTLVEVYQELAAELPEAIRETRPCVTHCNFISDEAIRIMQEVGIVADIQPPWLYMDGAMLIAHFGSERMRRFQPLRRMLKLGIPISGGSDHMKKIGSRRSINPYNPFLGMWAAITRRPREGGGSPLHPEQGLSRMQALRMYTTNSAYVLFREDETGSLEEGKLADFIVIDRDFLACPEDEIKDIEVLKTFLGGEQVYARKPGQQVAGARA